MVTEAPVVEVAIAVLTAEAEADVVVTAAAIEVDAVETEIAATIFSSISKLTETLVKKYELSLIQMPVLLKPGKT